LATEPLNTSTNSIKSHRRPTNDDQAEALKAVVEYIENNENDSLTISDLVKKIFKICGDQCYYAKHMKRKTEEHFGESVIISSIDGKNNIVALRESVYSIVHTFYKTSVELSDEETSVELPDEERKREIIESDCCKTY
jgi:YesN/AraC family two-component response regulator